MVSSSTGTFGIATEPGPSATRHRAAAGNVAAERILKSGGHGGEIGQNDDGVIGKLDVGGLLRTQRFELKRGIRRSVERGLVVQQGSRTAAIVDEQNLSRVGTLHCKNETIVGRERVGRIDPDFPAAESVRRVEAEKLGLRAAVFTDIHGFSSENFSIQQQRNGALGRGRTESGDHDLKAHLFGIVHAPGGDDAFNGPVRRGLPDLMGDQRGARREAEIGKTGRHGGVLKVAGQIQLDGQLHRFGQRSRVSRQLAERSAAIGWLDGGDGGSRFGEIGGGLGQRLHLGSERDHLYLIARPEVGENLQRCILGSLKMVARAHAERTVDGDHGEVLLLGQRDRPADKRVGEQKGEQDQHRRAQRKQQNVVETTVLH